MCNWLYEKCALICSRCYITTYLGGNLDFPQIKKLKKAYSDQAEICSNTVKCYKNGLFLFFSWVENLDFLDLLRKSFITYRRLKVISRKQFVELKTDLKVIQTSLTFSGEFWESGCGPITFCTITSSTSSCKGGTSTEKIISIIRSSSNSLFFIQQCWKTF